MGKSRLIEEFIKEKDAVSVLIVPKEERQIARDIEREIRSKLGYSPPFTSVTDAISYLFEKGVELVWIDEFPNLLAANPDVSTVLPELLEKYKNKEMLFIVSGSHAGMMKHTLPNAAINTRTAGKSPPLNHATATLNLKPLTLRTAIEILNDLGVDSPQQQIGFYCIFGGIPYHYKLIEKLANRSIEGAVSALFYEFGAQLCEEGDAILRPAFGSSYARYYAVLEAIGGSSVPLDEISQRVGLKPATLTRYLNALYTDFRLLGRDLPFNEDPSGKGGVYYIKDSMLAFWFSSVYGKRHTPTKEELDSFIASRFEIFCREYLSSYLEERGKTVKSAGRWWGQVELEGGRQERREINLVIETDKALYLGDCKWASQKAGGAELKRLVESSRALAGTGAAQEKAVRFVLFSREGFESMASGESLLFDSDMIVKGL